MALPVLVAAVVEVVEVAVLVEHAPPAVAPLPGALAAAQRGLPGALVRAEPAAGADLPGRAGGGGGAAAPAPAQAVVLVLVVVPVVVVQPGAAEGEGARLLAPPLVALLPVLAEAPGVVPVAPVHLPDPLADALPAVVVATVARAVPVARATLRGAVPTPSKDYLKKKKR